MRVGWLQSKFLKDVSVVSTGSLAAHAITVISAPILTRLYTPADFGIFGVFFALTMVLAPAIAGKFDETIVVVHEDDDVPKALALSALTSLFLSALLLATALLVAYTYPDFVDQAGLRKVILLLPVALALNGLNNTGLNLAIRQRKFQDVALLKALQAAAVAVASIMFYYLGATHIGLVLGLVLGLFCSFVFLLWRLGSSLGGLRTLTTEGLAAFAVQFKAFPLYSATGTVFGGLVEQLPLLVISRYFPLPIVGNYSLVARVAFAPLAFLSVAIGHVNMQRVASLARSGQPILPFLVRVVAAFSAIVAIPTVIFVLWAPGLFELVFGAPWRDAGIYLQILMPALAMRLIAITFAGTIEATRNNHFALTWKLCALVVTLAVLGIYAPAGQILDLLHAKMVADVVMYAIFIALIAYSAANPKHTPVTPASSTSDAGTGGSIG